MPVMLRNTEGQIVSVSTPLEIEKRAYRAALPRLRAEQEARKRDLAREKRKAHYAAKPPWEFGRLRRKVKVPHPDKEQGTLKVRKGSLAVRVNRGRWDWHFSCLQHGGLYKVHLLPWDYEAGMILFVDPREKRSLETPLLTDAMSAEERNALHSAWLDGWINVLSATEEDGEDLLEVLPLDDMPLVWRCELTVGSYGVALPSVFPALGETLCQSYQCPCTATHVTLHNDWGAVSYYPVCDEHAPKYRDGDKKGQTNPLGYFMAAD